MTETLVDEIADKLINGDIISKIQGAREIRNMFRNRKCSGNISTKFGCAGAIQPLVHMLNSQHNDAQEASLIALLNLASRNQRNKEQIVTCGVIPPLVTLLKFENTNNLRELATATILSLSAAPNNKLAIANSEAVPLFIQLLNRGSFQARIEAVTALHNLTTSKIEPIIVIDATAAVPLINLLKECRKYSNVADRTTRSIGLITKTQEGILAVTKAEDGILTLVETIEDGSQVSTEHAVGALLDICMSSRSKYRELILKEGAIPGLLKLTVRGTLKAQNKARMLLGLLRCYRSEKRLSPSVLEKLSHDIAACIDGSEKTVQAAKILLLHMIQRSMNKASSCTTEN
ncbi:U-box domain-containing protein 45-like [Rutidosis leptorrhynchoides]|uniref:U-box domain-containing protein 45-like n=1 Tax=Rutidosis leptorrhynchoides TaxID=125765 RepID=UPI003A9A5AB2